jgi:hypothetical protein
MFGARLLEIHRFREKAVDEGARHSA